MKNIFNNVKVTLLNNDIIRFECAPDGTFSNQESLFISNKNESNKQLDFIKNEFIRFNYQDFTFEFNENNPLESLKVYKENKLVYQYKEIRNSGELPLPNKTPEIFPLMDSPRLLIPADGYVKGNQGFILQENVKDLYLLVCGSDYLKLRRQFIQLTGANDLPRLKTLGLFSSRYFKYSQKSAIEMIRNYKKHQIPLDTFIVDTDWRDMEKLQGCGYTINEKLFPNMSEFFKTAHSLNVDVMMNDHPLPLTDTSLVLDETEMDYRNKNLTKLYNLGLDGWWYDRNWTCKLNSGSRRIESESLGNYLFHDVTKQFYSGFTLDPEVRERNLVMSNINNIVNGEYRGILDSRSHRYALQWSGDTFSTEQALRNEIINLNKCANNMIAFYSSDIGGHEGNPNKKQFIRWWQYGSLSPIMRPHCTCSVSKFREPWNYDKKTLEICRDFINIRYSLLNVFYTAAFKNVDQGLGVCSPLYLYYPEDKKCYKENTSYMLGDSILVSPITDVDEPKFVTKNNFSNKLKLTIYPNDSFKGPKSYTRNVKSLVDISRFYAEVKAKNRKVKKFSFRFKGDLRFASNVQLAIINEVDANVYINGKDVFQNKKYIAHTYKELTNLSKNRNYKLVLETVQGRKLKNVNLCYYHLLKNKKTKIYLPEGEWFNIFHRNVYQGRRYVKEKFKIDEMPVFVKAGSLLPLYTKIENISKMSLKNVVYDYYTSKTADNTNFFYEDDERTTAYTIGVYRQNKYRTHFENNRYIVELFGSDVVLDDGIKVRDVKFKAHIRDNETIDSVLINGESIRFKRHDHSKKVKPFLDNMFAKDSKTLSFKFRQSIKDNYKIELIIRQK